MGIRRAQQQHASEILFRLRHCDRDVHHLHDLAAKRRLSADDISLAGKVKHPPFNEEKRQKLRQMKAALDEVYPKTIEELEDTFRKDSDPDQEIAIWLHIASVYQQSTAGKKLTLPQRKECLMLILACSRSPQEHVFEIFQPKTITRQEAEQVVELYFSR